MELLRSTSYRGLSLRSLLTFVLAVLMSALLLVTLASPASHAQAESGSWSGETIIHDGRQYNARGETEAGEIPGVPEGSPHYTYLSTDSRTMYVLYFAPGVDPPTTTSAEFVQFDYDDGTYSNPAEARTITLTVQAESDAYSSCSIGGIGWIICPVTIFLAESMDWIFETVSSFLVVQPIVTGDNESDLYVVWNVMRNIANVAFIVSFLIIIFSQLTSLGINNYGLKKLLPRLVISAILVNVSFIICAIAIDLSNVIGYSLQDILIQLRQQTFDMTRENELSWDGIAQFVLAGGAIGGVYAGLAAAGGVAGAAYLLIPLLVGLVLTALFVLFILAARQAIIIILIAIAPLAFVAYLLPNTESWFKKWRDLFMTMLIFFPAFSLVFGGSQLAGGIIIENAGDNLIMLIFGMAVQVAPLVITPLLLKLSGGLLGRIAGIVNDPRKGALDRAKNWAGDRSGMERAKYLGEKARLPFTPQWMAQRMDNANRRTKGRTSVYQQYGDNRYDATKQNSEVHELMHDAKLDHQTIEASLNQHIQAKTNLRGSSLHAKNVKLEAAKLALETMVQITNADIDEYKAGSTANAPRSLAPYINDLNQSRQQLAIEKMRADSAVGEQQDALATALEASVSLQKRAGGIDKDGAQRALASAIATQTKSQQETIANAGTILSHYNYGDDVVTKIALNDPDALKGQPNKISITEDVRAAAISRIAGGGNANAILELVKNIPSADLDNSQLLRQTLADTLIKNSARPKFVGAGTIAKIKQGIAPTEGDGRIHEFVVETINANKLGSAETLVSQDKEYLKAVLDTLQNNKSGIALNAPELAELKNAIAMARKDNRFASRIAERRDEIDGIDNLI